MSKTKGFTLIELLVVIAIIGILAAIVLVALGDAQDRARDATIQSELGQMRAQAQLYIPDSDNNVGYQNVCGHDDSTLGDGDITDLLESVDDISDDAGCGDSKDQWAVWAKLRSNDDYWCVDYTGFSGTVDNSTGSNYTEGPGGQTECD